MNNLKKFITFETLQENNDNYLFVNWDFTNKKVNKIMENDFNFDVNNIIQFENRVPVETFVTEYKKLLEERKEMFF
jgi:hypothetical protein